MTNRIVTVVLRGDISDLTGKLAAVSKSVKTSATDMTGASKESARFRDGLTGIGNTAGKIGLVATAGIGAVVLATANFDKAMSAVAASTDVSANSLNKLREAAIEAGARTAFSATEAAGGIEELAKAGVSTSDILAGGLNGALDLAAAGALSVADASSIAATTLNQFGLSGNQTVHVADLLTSAANAAQGSVTDVGNALKYVGPVAAQMGVSLEETTGVIAELASQGILADQAGTALRGMLTALTSPSKIAADEMGKLGINVYDAQGKFVGFKGIAGQLHDTLGRLGDAERDQALGRIFGNEQITAARILYKGGAADVAKWTDAVDKDGAAADAAGERLNNLAGDFEAFKGSLETALIGSGEGSSGALRELTQQATGAVNEFNKLPGPIKESGVAMLGITAVLGGGLWFTAKTISGIANMRDNLSDLGVTGSSSISKIGRVAGTAAIALTALEVASQFAPEAKFAKTSEYTKAILELGTNAGKASGQLDKLFTVSGSAGTSIEGLGGAFEAVSHNGFLTFLDKAGGAFGIFDSDIGLATQSFESFDQGLTSLVNSGALDEAARGAKYFAEQGKAAGLSTSEIKGLLDDYYDALGNVANQQQLTGDGAATAGDSITGLGLSADGTNDQIKKLSESLSGLLDPLLEQDAASNAYKDSLASLAGDLRKNGTSLDDNTVKGRANQDAIRDRVKALEESITADEEAGVGQQQLSDKLLQGAKDILAAGTAAGVSKDAMKGYLEQLGLTPDQIKTLITADNKQAKTVIQQTLDALAQIRSKEIFIKASFTGNAAGAALGKINQAQGGIVDYYADGGITATGPSAAHFANGGIRSENHVAQIAPAGAMRVWAEPETGGEAYIPFAQSKRKRSQEIAMQTAQRLGGVAYFAQGGFSAGGGVAAGNTSIDFNVSAPSGLNEEQIARIAAQRLLFAMAR